MNNLVQVVPLAMHDRMPYAYLGLDTAGRLWYGRLAYDNQQDGGPSKIAWRPIEEE